MNNFTSRNPQSFGLRLSSVVLAAAMFLTPGLASASSTSETQNPLNGNIVLADAASGKRVETVSINATNKTLCEVMRQIRTRSGADVKVPESLSGDLISRSAQGGNWQAAVEHLLEGYNYSAVWGKDGQPLQLSVYSRNKYANEPAVATAATATAVSGASEDLLVYDTSAFALPQKYQGLNPGSVSPVSLPVERMRQMALGEKVSLTLPCGQFSVVHDNQIQQENGDFIWVGYLENAERSYRVIITMGSNGNLGQVMTPDAVYNLDFVEGRTWLVNVGTEGSETESQMSQGI